MQICKYANLYVRENKIVEMWYRVARGSAARGGQQWVGEEGEASCVDTWSGVTDSPASW